MATIPRPLTVSEELNQATGASGRWWRLYIRAVLPDEIDAMPEEPAPDEGLIERVAIAAWQASRVSPTEWDELGDDEIESWRRRARAVLAEIATVDSLKRITLAITDGMHDWWDEERIIAHIKGIQTNLTSAHQSTDRARKRVAGLEAELKHCGERDARRIEAFQRDLTDTTERMIRAENNLATVTRERDEWVKCAHAVGLTGGPGSMQQVAHMAKAACDAMGVERDDTSPRDIRDAFDSLTRELAEAKRVGDEATKNGWGAIHDRDRLARELAEAKATITQLESDLERDQQELVDAYRQVAETREELRKLYAAIVRTGHGRVNDHWCQIHDLLDAHRAKPSGAAASVSDREIDKSNAAAPVSYETRQTLEPGVRYRVVERRGGSSPPVDWKFEATGHERIVEEPGWYEFTGGAGMNRVVRVEPEKAPTESFREPAPKLEEWRCPPAEPGIRAVHHVHDGGGERSGQPLGDNESLRRSGQLEAKAEPYQYPDNDKRPFTPIADAATVADLARRVDRLERAESAYDGCEHQDIVKEIRAERAGRK